MNTLAWLFPRNAVEANIYHCKQSVKFVRKYISRTHVRHILCYPSYPVYNIWVQLCSSSYNNTVSMYYIIMHYNDLLTNMDAYVYVDAYMCTYIQGKCNMVRI